MDVVRARSEPTWTHVELDAGHLVPLTKPRMLVDIAGLTIGAEKG